MKNVTTRASQKGNHPSCLSIVSPRKSLRLLLIASVIMAISLVSYTTTSNAAVISGGGSCYQQSIATNSVSNTDSKQCWYEDPDTSNPTFVDCTTTIQYVPTLYGCAPASGSGGNKCDPETVLGYTRSPIDCNNQSDPLPPGQDFFIPCKVSERTETQHTSYKVSGTCSPKGPAKEDPALQDQVDSSVPDWRDFN